MIFNRTIAYIFVCLFCVSVVGMDAERVNPSKECYESNQKKLTLILCAFRQENVGLPGDVGRIIAFKYAEEEIEKGKEIARKMRYSCHIPMAYIRGRNACSLIDLLFLNQDQCCGMVTMSGIDNIYRLVSWTSEWPTWEWLPVKARAMSITEGQFAQAMLVPRRLRKKLFADSDSTVKVFKFEELERFEDHFDELLTHQRTVELRSFLEDKQLCIADK